MTDLEGIQGRSLLPSLNKLIALIDDEFSIDDWHHTRP